MDQFIGLTNQEAAQKLKEFGPNEIQEVNSVSPFKILLRQIQKNFVIYLLVAAAIISLLVGKGITGYVILIVVFLVIITGFIQEFKAEKSIQALKKMITPSTIVKRNGKEQEVPSCELVPYDIIILRTGEKIPADCIVLDESELKTNESILTGEAIDVKKNAIKNNQDASDENMLFMGTFVVNGRCVAKILHTGMSTRFGKIASMISSAEKQLPLQDKINVISKYMVVIAIIVSTLTGLVMIMRAPELTNEVVINILILVIALSVSAFPEGLPVVLISTLAVGANRMAKKNAIVNRMSIIETLGETTVICSDKTGTLTRGEMTVRKIYTDEKIYDVSGVGYESNGDFLLDNKKQKIQIHSPLEMSMRAAIICNDSLIERSEEEKNEYHVNGSSTEGALLIMAAKGGVLKDDILFKRIEEMPFSSDRKMMSVLVDENGNYNVYAKGAPEMMLNKCTHIFKDGKNITLSAQSRREIEGFNSSLTSSAYRTLVLAYKPLKEKNKEYKEDDLTFLGIVGIEDPPREEVKQAIKVCERAGIKVKMITGDNKETAVAVGKQIGIDGKVLEGKILDELSDEELSKAVNEVVIFARVRPEHKLRIVKALKANGEIVTMTGDGVNDAPSLKEAHIGVAMGKNGTDVSRSVADITLKDDNFATIVTAIREGRGIFNNIRKFVTYQLSCNLAELSILFFGVLLAPLFGWQTPLLLALHILFMNLVTDNLPAITLGFNPSSKDIMLEKPRRKAQILTKEFIRVIIFNGGLMCLSTLFMYFVTFNILKQTADVSRTAALITLILVEISSAFNFRSFRFGVINKEVFRNKYLVYASVISLILTIVIVYTPVRVVFETVPVHGLIWVQAFLISFIPVIIFDLLKEINNKTHKLLPHTT